MLISKTEIEKVIPQRSPIVMVDCLLSVSETEATTSFTVLDTNMFVENGRLTESGLLENIAQTAAAKVGYHCLKQNVPTPPGFIGSIKNLKVTDFPKVGEELITTIAIENEIFGCTLMTGRIESARKTIASGEYKIYIQSGETA